MSPQGTAWSIGIVLTVSLSGYLARDEASRDLAGPVALLGLALSALIAEISAIPARLRGQTLDLSKGSRPADGIVEIVAMEGVEGQINPASPRFRRFLRLLDDSGKLARVASLVTRCPRLEGQVVLVSVFVGRDGLAWTEEEIARGHAALERAGLWIERQAGRYSAKVNVGLADTYFAIQDDEVDEVEVAFAAEMGDVGPMEGRATIKAIVAASRAASLLGFSDVVDWLGTIEPRLDADATAWLFHLRRSGRSLAISIEDSDLAGVGLAVCYSNETSFPEPLDGSGRVHPTTIAHELLHLFGATDKYGVRLRSFQAGSVGPGDIMRLAHSRLQSMTIDGLTASELGWNRDRRLDEKHPPLTPNG